MTTAKDRKHSAGEQTAQMTVDNALIQDLPAGFHFDTHMHRTVEILICLSGCVTITVQGVPLVVEAGEYITVFPNVLHSADVHGELPCRILQMHFHSPPFSKALYANVPGSELGFPFELSLDKRKFFKGRSTPQLEACLSGVHTELSCLSENGKAMVSLYLAQLNLLLSRDLSASSEGRHLYENRYLLSATLFVNEHYMEKITVGDVAHAVNVSPRYLTRMFQKQLNLGVSTYITYVRISKAIDFMYANQRYPLTALALDMGFSSQQHFSKVFKEKMGVAPKKYFSIRPITSC